MSVERQAPRWAGAARMLGAAMTGLDEAMFGPKEERPGVVIDAPGDPPNDLPFDVLLDQEHPERSIVVFHASDAAPPAV
jgi:hypothetical protein